MKKEILNLINSESGIFRLNNISYLHRWTKNALGEKVDCLDIEFDCINDVNFGFIDGKIHSRDYDGIIDECSKKTEEFLKAVSETLCKSLNAGYRNKQ